MLRRGSPITSDKDIKGVMMVFIIALSLLVIAEVLGFFIYASYDFTAEVESIDFYGRPAGFTGGADKAIIRFKEG